MKGYLYKRIASGDWQKRYFELYDNYLAYYKSENHPNCVAVIAVAHIAAVRRIPNTDVGIYQTEECCFQIDIRDKQYDLRAKSNGEADLWVHNITNMRCRIVYEEKIMNKWEQFINKQAEDIKSKQKQLKSTQMIELNDQQHDVVGKHDEDLASSIRCGAPCGRRVSPSDTFDKDDSDSDGDGKNIPNIGLGRIFCCLSKPKIHSNTQRRQLQ